jgi:hypothetical protein
MIFPPASFPPNTHTPLPRRRGDLVLFAARPLPPGGGPLYLRMEISRHTTTQ